MVKILAMAGSTRTESFNKKLLRHAVVGAQATGAEVTIVDLREFPLPLYDGDLEEKDGIPLNGRELKKIFLDHHGFIFALPEYNSSISGVFKNAIDWISRSTQGEAPLAAFKNKVAALVSASPGALGGIRGLVHARSMLQNINVLVIPEQICVGKAMEAFDQESNLKDEKLKLSVEKVGNSLAQLAIKLNFAK